MRVQWKNALGAACLAVLVGAVLGAGYAFVVDANRKQCESMNVLRETQGESLQASVKLRRAAHLPGAKDAYRRLRRLVASVRPREGREPFRVDCKEANP